MFRERLVPVEGNPNLASPTGLAKMAASNLQNAQLTTELWRIISDQCLMRRNVEPFFRFLEIALAVPIPFPLTFVFRYLILMVRNSLNP